MELSIVKSEASPRTRSFCLAESDIPENKCVKRRRRSPSAKTLANEASQGGPDQDQQQPQTLQVDQNNGANATTTVKRSSRFRGVSR